MSQRGRVSVVVPILNEAEVVDELHRRLTNVMSAIGPYEIVVVDDGSSDGSWERLVSMAAHDDHLHLIRLSWIGFPRVGVPYHKEARYAGETKFPLPKMLKFAADATTSFSTAPLRLITGLGFVTVLFCVVYLVDTLYLRFFTSDTVPGWTSVIVVILFLGGVQLLSLGIVAEYIGRIFEETKERALYLVDEVVRAPAGFEPPVGRTARVPGAGRASASPQP